MALERTFGQTPAHTILPLDVDARMLTVCMSDPLAIDALDQVRQLAKKHIQEVVVTPSQLERYIPTYLDQLDQRKVASEMDVILKGLAADDVQAIADTDAKEASTVKESDNSIIKLANQIVIDAYRRGASDIHITPSVSSFGNARVARLAASQATKAASRCTSCSSAATSSSAAFNVKHRSTKFER